MPRASQHSNPIRRSSSTVYNLVFIQNVNCTNPIAPDGWGLCLTFFIFVASALISFIGIKFQGTELPNPLVGAPSLQVWGAIGGLLLFPVGVVRVLLRRCGFHGMLLGASLLVASLLSLIFYENPLLLIIPPLCILIAWNRAVAHRSKAQFQRGLVGIWGWVGGMMKKMRGRGGEGGVGLEIV